ncbi:ankyrin repeat domain-containing protein [Iodobacter sp. HSC-16F04]|uniref:Ankyrin repeat domain-containing protein n=1 Tax=Iodobacter violaceini TaxID=3044271 RepID=A0ABX0KS99_9NEIS|nr:ankyrin repeat domain-containing protein [Iodobacter violacea]NHQ85573.1 ankyrin repeat domain-containing protein [Iodobacter violacea]
MPEVTSRDLLRAVMRGEIEKLAALMESGVSLTEKSKEEGWSLIHSASLSVSRKVPPESLRFLISSGIDATGTDMYGNTPLHYVVRNSDLESAKILVESGSDVNLPNNEGITPLHQALVSNPIDFSLVEYLLSVGGDQNHKIGSEKTIRDFVTVISHGKNASLKGLFEKRKPGADHG